jgi:hypothetical protein
MAKRGKEEAEDCAAAPQRRSTTKGGENMMAGV